MKKPTLVLLLATVAVIAFLLGRATQPSLPLPDQTEAGGGAPSPSPSPTGDLVPRPHRPILRHFATMDEQELPQQGVLGGTMVAGTIAFRKEFSREPRQRFYVVGSDGHLLETWTYEVNKTGFWKHVETHEGYAPVDFEDHLDTYDVYLWRPSFYIRAKAG